ncbi:SIS domain-containing protein [Verrucomicrobium sp. GAS474]|uniref:SIS domain-containing protein n=1 Tax=Verrucomicrobium sp. GAS474 TaxID=1882831 RepID=UPI0018D28E09|nr:SIS domain-containing protein [Verrucomicrobium sp. GAS474]
MSVALGAFDWEPVSQMASDFHAAWQEDRQIFICGNGGSAANAVHWGNDFLYPIAKKGTARGIRIHSLNGNEAVTTCLANDIGYDQIFSHQLATFARRGDLLVTLSGSGNSSNILAVLDSAKSLGLKSYAIVGFDGGKAKALADLPIHIAVHDMQIAEDFQMIVCHALVQSLLAHPVPSL